MQSRGLGRVGGLKNGDEEFESTEREDLDIDGGLALYCLDTHLVLGNFYVNTRISLNSRRPKCPSMKKTNNLLIPIAYCTGMST